MVRPGALRNPVTGQAGCAGKSHLVLVRLWYVGFLPLLIFSSCRTGEVALQPDTPRYGYQVVNSYPHDNEAFTQGLIWIDGYLYESTGRRGYSTLRKVDLETGNILKLKQLDDNLFGEGLTAWDGRLIQLTLSAGTGFVYDIETFEQVETFRYEGAGWGLTNDGERLIMSDGSAFLRFLDPTSFEGLGRLEVTEGGEPMENINELQMVGDTLFANILFSEEIAMIDLESGEVIGRIDLRGMLIPPEEGRPPNVLNGIAYDDVNDRLFVTGKLWPRLFEIEIVSREKSERGNELGVDY